jgi:hypothetical protein
MTRAKRFLERVLLVLVLAVALGVASGCTDSGRSLRYDGAGRLSTAESTHVEDERVCLRKAHFRRLHDLHVARPFHARR